MRPLRHCLPALLWLYLSPAHGQTIPLLHDIYRQETNRQVLFGNQHLRLAVDRQTGQWASLELLTGALRGDLLTTTAVPAAVDFSVNGVWQLAATPGTYLRHTYGIDRNRQGATLAVMVGVGAPDKATGTYAYELTTTYRLLPGTRHLERTAQVTRHAPGERLHFDGFRFEVPGAHVGEQTDTQITVPGPFWAKSLLRAGTPYDSLVNKTMGFHAAPDLGFGLLLLTNEKGHTTLGSYVETGGEVNYTSSLQGNGHTLTLRHDDNRAYYLAPGQTISSDIHHLDVSESVTDALAAYRNMVTATLPVDTKTPAWVREQVILEVYPAYYKGGLSELTARLPFYKSVGFTMIYLMPHWVGGYSPIDLYKVDPAFGKPDELKALVKTAHNLGLKVIFDMVIHGFNVKSKVPQERPDLFVRNENGKLGFHPTWGSVTPDWASPAYRQYMVDLVLHDQREYGNDGYRVDAAAFKGPGWNPGVSYPAYRDGTAAPDLLKTMLAALRQKNPEAVLLSEVFGPVYYTVCNFAHDNQTEAIATLQRRVAAGSYTAEDYRQHLRGVFGMLPAGANRVFFARNHDTSWFDRFDGYDGRFMAFEAIHALFGIPEIFAGDPDNNYTPDDDGGRVYNLYKKLFAFRKQRPEFIHGAVQLTQVSSDNAMIFCGLRTWKGKSSLVLANFSGQPQTTNITGVQTTTVLTLTDVYAGTAVSTRAGSGRLTVTLAPFQVLAGAIDSGE